MRKTDLLQAIMKIPGNPHVVVTSEGLRRTTGPGIYREGAPDSEVAMLNGFSRSELLAEEIDVTLLDNEILCIYLKTS